MTRFLETPDQKYFRELGELEQARIKQQTWTAVCFNCLKPIFDENHVCKKGTTP